MDQQQPKVAQMIKSEAGNRPKNDPSLKDHVFFNLITLNNSSLQSNYNGINFIVL